MPPRPNSVAAALLLVAAAHLHLGGVTAYPIWWLGRSITNGFPCTQHPAAGTSVYIGAHRPTDTPDTGITITILNNASRPATSACPGERLTIKVNMGRVAGPNGTSTLASRHMFMTASLGSFGSAGKKAEWLATINFQGSQFQDKPCPNRIAYLQQRSSFREALTLPCKAKPDANTTALTLRVTAASEGCWEAGCDTQLRWTQLTLPLLPAAKCTGFCKKAAKGH